MSVVVLLFYSGYLATWILVPLLGVCSNPSDNSIENFVNYHQGSLTSEGVYNENKVH